MMSLHDHLAQANTLVAGGDLPGAIAQFERILTPIFDLGPTAVDGIPDGPRVILDASRELTDLLRWDRRYDDAIALQHQIARVLPAEGAACRITAATLMIEAGDTANGLAALQTEAAALDPVAGHLLLAQTYAWLLDFDHAETHLRALCADAGASADDRGTAQHLLFQILGMQKKIGPAREAWEAARATLHDTDETLPELVRMLIYWYQYDAALEYLARDPSEIRRTFYRALINGKSAAPKGREDWRWVDDFDAATLTQGHEEYAEAALRFAAPDVALDILMPLIEQQALTRRPLMLAGLAFAQQRDLARARWALDQALRLADLESPRRTRAGAGQNRIFDAETRMTYGEVPVDPDVRAHLDHYFMPKGQIH